MMKRMGLFGSPGSTAFAEMNQGVGELNPLTSQPLDVMQAPQMKPAKPGFNEPGGWGEKLAMIGSVLTGDGGNSVALAPYMLRRQQELASQRAQQQRAQEWEDWQRKQEWERANPKPVNNDTINDFNWFKSLSPEDRRLYGQMKPQYITTDNGDGTKTIVPVTPGMFGGQGGGNPQVIGNQLPQGWIIEGGPAGNGGGNFR